MYVVDACVTAVVPTHVPPLNASIPAASRPAAAQAAAFPEEHWSVESTNKTTIEPGAAGTVGENEISTSLRLPAAGPETLPDAATYDPLPAELVSTKLLVSTPHTVHVPLAAVFPSTPEIATISPSWKPCPAAVQRIGVVFVHAVIDTVV